MSEYSLPTKKINFIIFFLFLYILFFPTFIGGMGLFIGQKVLYLSLPLILLIISILRPKYKIKYDGFAIYLLFIFCFIFITICSKFSFLNVQIVLSHMRYFIYFIVYICAYNLAMRSNIGAGQYLFLLKIFSWLIVIFFLFQLVAPDLAIKTGISNRKIINWLGVNIGGPLIWSYAYTFVTVAITFSLIWVVLEKRASFMEKILLIILFITIAISQSKAAYLAYFFLIIFAICMGYWFANKRASTFMFLYSLAFVFSSGIYIYLNLEEFGNVARFINGIQGTGTDESTETRLKQLSNLKLVIENNIMFGFPSNYKIIENAYGYYFYNYGLLGLVLYILTMTLVTLKAWKCFKYSIKHSSHKNIKAFYFGLVCFSISTFVFSLGSSPIDGHKTSYFYWLLIGLSFGSISLQKEEYKRFKHG